jgi:hypothetical protein
MGMDEADRNIALVLILGHLQAALEVIKGIEKQAFGVTEDDMEALEPELQAVAGALANSIHAVVRRLPGGETLARPEN